MDERLGDHLMRGTERTAPAKPGNPGKAKGNGLKAAFGPARGAKGSKLAPMGGAKKKER